MAGTDDRDRLGAGATDPVEVFDLEWIGMGGAPSGLVRLEFDLMSGSTRAAVVFEPDPGPVVALVAHDLPLPVDHFELRGPGLWIDLVCEAPFDHWTVGLEAFGVTIDDGQALSADSRGDVVPMGLDLDLDTADPGPREEAVGLRIPVRVHGEILIGPDSHELDARGTRWRGGIDAPAGSALASTRARIRLDPG